MKCWCKEESEDTKEVIRNRKSKKNKEHNDQKKKKKETNNDLQNIKQKTKDQATGTPLKTRGERRCSERVRSSCSTKDIPQNTATCVLIIS